MVRERRAIMRARSLHTLFTARVQGMLTPGIRILDVGSGRTPVIAPEKRPPGCWYVGMDTSFAMLLYAPTGSYDEAHVIDVTGRVRTLEGRFDLIVSSRVLDERMRLARATENLRAYLRPGGRLMAQTSANRSAIVDVSDRVGRWFSVWMRHRLFGHTPQTRGHNDQHRYTRLARAFRRWRQSEILPLAGDQLNRAGSSRSGSSRSADEQRLTSSDDQVRPAYYLVTAIKG